MKLRRGDSHGARPRGAVPPPLISWGADIPGDGGYTAPAMRFEDEICYCYHVSMRKLMNFSRRTKPRRPSEMTRCLDAGTGCGWCIPFLIKIAQDPDAFELDDTTPEEYASKRMTYRSTEQPKNRFDDDTYCGSVQSPATEDGPDQCQAEDAGDQIADEGEVLDADV